MKRKDFSDLKIETQNEKDIYFEHEEFIAGTVPFLRGIYPTMYLEKTDAFVEAADKTKGRTRAYLGTHLQDLLNSDNEEELVQFKASKPRAIPQTPFWVITNANTGRKRIILTQMMASMGYPHHLIERIKEEI